MKWYELCDKPYLYEDTYWGGFKGEPDEGIIDNRNIFVLEYGIVKHTKPKSYWYLNHIYGLDHVEVYLSNKFEYIVIMSVYENIKYEEEGWKKIYKLYSNTLTTYYKEYPYSKEDFLIKSARYYRK